MKRMNYLLALAIATAFCLSGCANVAPATAASSGSEPTKGVSAELADATTPDPAPAQIASREFAKDLPNEFMLYGGDVGALLFQNDTTSIELFVDDNLEHPWSGETYSGVALVISNNVLDGTEPYRNKGYYHNPDTGSPTIALAFCDTVDYFIAQEDGENYLSSNLAQLMRNLMENADATTETVLGLSPEQLSTDGNDALYITVMMTGEEQNVIVASFESSDESIVIAWENRDGQSRYYATDGDEKVSLEGDLIKFSPTVMKNLIGRFIQVMGRAGASVPALVPAPIVPAESVSDPLEGTTEMQKITPEQRKEFEAMLNGDFSAIAGRYELNEAVSGIHSFSSGTIITISENGDARFSDYEDYLGNVYHNLVFTPSPIKNEEMLQDELERIKTDPGRVPFTVWGIDYHPESSVNVDRGGAKPWPFSLVLTYYPEEMELAEVAKSGGSTNYIRDILPTDTSKKRLLVGVGYYYVDTEDPTAVFTQIDEEAHAQESAEEMKRYNELVEANTPSSTKNFVSVKTTEEWPRGFELDDDYFEAAGSATYSSDYGWVQVEMLADNFLGEVDNWCYHGVRVTICEYQVDPAQPLPVFEFLDDMDMAVKTSFTTGTGFTPKLAEYIRGLMENRFPTEVGG